jgi:hypothetical protein
VVERAQLRYQVEVGAGSRARERAREVGQRAPALKTTAAAASILQLTRHRAGSCARANREADVVVVEVEVEVYGEGI